MTEDLSTCQSLDEVVVVDLARVWADPSALAKGHCTVKLLGSKLIRSCVVILAASKG